MDYFGARYYSSAQGRFTSPDEFNGGPVEFFAAAESSNPTFYADLTNPQSLNKYQYCLNNPLRHVDPDGHDPDDGDNGVVSGAISFLKGVGSGAASVVVGTAKLVKDTVVGCASCVMDSVVDQVKQVGSTLKADFDYATHPKETAAAISSAVKEGGSDNALNIVGNATGQVLASAAIAKGVKALGGALKGGAGLTTPGKYFGNLTKAEAETALGNKIGAPRSVRPEAKTYYNPRTRRSFNVHEEPGHQGGKPHVDVRRRGSATERKYPLKEK